VFTPSPLPRINVIFDPMFRDRAVTVDWRKIGLEQALAPEQRVRTTSIA